MRGVPFVSPVASKGKVGNESHANPECIVEQCMKPNRATEPNEAVQLLTQSCPTLANPEDKEPEFTFQAVFAHIVLLGPRRQAVCEEI